MREDLRKDLRSFGVDFRYLRLGGDWWLLPNVVGLFEMLISTAAVGGIMFMPLMFRGSLHDDEEGSITGLFSFRAH